MASPDSTADPTPDTTEPIDVEVVDPTAPDADTSFDPPPATALEPVQSDATPPSALVAATDAALAMPGVAGRDEFLALAMQARVLSMSGAAPKAVRNNPYVALHVAMVGRDLGISPSAALELIDVLGDGDKTQLSLSPQLLAGQVRRLGLGTIERGPCTNERCVAFAVEPGGRLDRRCARLGEHWVSGDGYDECTCVGVLGVSEFTWKDAQIAGLVNRGCPSPTEHTCGSKPYRDQCRGGWLKYPKRMLWWRACGYVVDDCFPEAGLGLYTAEELGAEVDENGRAIDPTSVPLPEGYDEPQPDVRFAAPDMIDTLKRQIDGLSDADKVALRSAWKTEDLPPLDRLSVRQFGRADKLVQAKIIAASEAATDTPIDADGVAAAFDATVVTDDPPDAPTGPATVPPVQSVPDDLAAALQGVPVDVVERAIAAVALLPRKAVTSALAMRGVDGKGSLDALRRQLAGMMAVEDHAQSTADPADGIDGPVDPT